MPCSFEFTVIGIDGNQEIHHYYPDFMNILTKEIIEIKGDHFFTEDGYSMKCPYSENRTEKEIEFMN